MDDVLHYADEYLLDSAYASLFPLRDYAPSSDLLADPTLKDSLCTLARSLANIGVKQPTDLGIGRSSAAATSASNAGAAAVLDGLSLFPRDSIIRQLTSFLFIAWGGSFLLYTIVSAFSYYVLFDRRLEHHPRFLPNQVRKEIALSLQSMPIIALMIVPWFVAEARGKTRMYSDIRQYGGEWFKGTMLEGYGHWVYVAGSMSIFLAATDYCIYWIHRWLHIPAIYKRLHKPHHKWVVPTPWAALAFHPLDGYSQSVPYHIIPFILPIHNWVYLGMFIFVNLWTILIHDGDMISGHFLEKYINSPAHHTLHHLYFTCNYGQYFTWADSMGGSYRPPRPDLDPIHEALKNFERKKKLAEKEQREALRRASFSSNTLRVEGLAAGEPVPALDMDGESDSGYEGSEAEMDEKEKVSLSAKSSAPSSPGAGDLRKRR